METQPTPRFTAGRLVLEKNSRVDLFHSREPNRAMTLLSSMIRFASSCLISFFVIGQIPVWAAKMQTMADLYGKEATYFNKNVERLQEQAWSLYLKAEYTAAAQALDEAAKLLEEDSGTHPRDRANLYVIIGEGGLILGHYAAAKHKFTDVISIARTDPSVGDVVLARCLKDLAAVSLVEERVADADDHISESFRILQRAGLTNSPSYALSLQARALLLMATGRYEDALSNFKWSSRIAEDAFGLTNYISGVNWSFRGVALFKQGDYANALPACQRGVELLQNCLAPDHLVVGQSLSYLALVYQSLGRHDLAFPLLLRNHSLLVKGLGFDHLQVAANLNIAGLAAYRAMQFAEAVKLFEDAYSIQAKVLGKENVPIALTLNNLGLAHQALEKHDKTEWCYNESLRILINTGGVEHPDVSTIMANLALLYHRQLKLEQAHRYYSRSLELALRSLGAEHPNVATGVENYPLFLMDLGSFDLGIQAYEAMFTYQRPYFVRQLLASTAGDAMDRIRRSFYSQEIFQTVS